MKKITILLITVLYYSIAIAQQINFVYTYDAAGNRVKRELAQPLPVMPLAVVQQDSSLQLTQPEPVNALNTPQTQDAPAFEVRLFPNPTSGWVNLELPEWQAGETGQITVHSQTGALVFQQKQVTAAQTLQLSNLLPGYYLVRIVVGEKMVIKGIIKQ